MGKPSDPDPRTPTADVAFVAERVFPDAAAAFERPSPTLRSAIPSCDVILDTNALLLPYRAGPASLEHIATALRALRDSGRLFVPGRVAREFARNRPAKLAELHQQLLDDKSKVQVPEPKTYPLLGGIPEYTAFSEAAEALRKAKESFAKATSALVGVVRSWNGDDPVSRVYSELFTPACVRDLAFEKEDFLKTMGERFGLEIPPGYKDAAKQDGGVGDLIIWMTILDLGRERKRPVVFVTGEEKADWYHRSAGLAFLPRFELVDEYRRAAGQPLYLAQLSELLELLTSDKNTVAEIRKEEQREREQLPETVDCPRCGKPTTVDLGRAIGSSAAPRCPACGVRYHAHRGPDGVFSRPWGGVEQVRGTKTWIGVHPKDGRTVVVLEGPEGVGRGVVYADSVDRPDVLDAGEIWREAGESSPIGSRGDPWACRDPLVVAAGQDWRLRPA